MDETGSKRAVGRFLKAARVDLDVKQKDAAKVAKISIPQIKQYESGAVMPRLTTALRLCNFYDVGWDKLGEVVANSLSDGGVVGSQEPELDHVTNAEVFDHSITPSPFFNLSRSEVRAFGQHIVMRRLANQGWQNITAVNAARKIQPNFDIRAEKDGKVVRLKVTTKKHATKTTLCIKWDRDQPSFNSRVDGEKADCLVMVRFTDQNDAECFVLSVQEAEKKADWMASEVIKLGNVPMYLLPYVGGPRKSRFKFNIREEWEPYAEAWDMLDANPVHTGEDNNEAAPPVPDVAPFPSLVIRVPDVNADPPARLGTDRYERFKILKTLNGKTIRDYYKACREAGIPCQKNNPILAHQKGFIVLIAP